MSISEIDDTNNEQDEKNEIYSKIVRAGKRTYFFDVKVTRKDDHYLTITESKKKLGKDGQAFYEKHKIFLYKEDFMKFANGLSDAIAFINSEEVGSISADAYDKEEKFENDALASVEYTNVEFEDLGEK